MMKKVYLLSLLYLCGCVGIEIPADFEYRVIHTKNFDIASWQKITNPFDGYKIYIEGDGHAFNAHGRATSDPTPQRTLVRKIAFGDSHSNVIYLARPCQYIKSEICAKRHWTTARFAPEIINAEYDAIKQIAKDSEIILVGFSGGAQVAGLVASAKVGLNIKKIVTIAGNLDHISWIKYHQIPPLNESMNLKDYKTKFLTIPQRHYVGSDDNIIPPFLVKNFIGNDALIIEIQGAMHSSNWDTAFQSIREE